MHSYLSLLVPGDALVGGQSFADRENALIHQTFLGSLKSNRLRSSPSSYSTIGSMYLTSLSTLVKQQKSAKREFWPRKSISLSSLFAPLSCLCREKERIFWPTSRQMSNSVHLSCFAVFVDMLFLILSQPMRFWVTKHRIHFEVVTPYGYLHVLAVDVV